MSGFVLHPLGLAALSSCESEGSLTTTGDRPAPSRLRKRRSSSSSSSLATSSALSSPKRTKTGLGSFQTSSSSASSTSSSKPSAPPKTAKIPHLNLACRISEDPKEFPGVISSFPAIEKPFVGLVDEAAKAALTWTFLGMLEVDLKLNGVTSLSQISGETKGKAKIQLKEGEAKKISLCFSRTRALVISSDGTVILSSIFGLAQDPWLLTLQRACKGNSAFVSGSLSFLPAQETGFLIASLRLSCFISGDLVLGPEEADFDDRGVSQAGVGLIKLFHPEKEGLKPCPFELFSLYKMVHSDNSLPLAPQPLGLVSELFPFQRRALCWMLHREGLKDLYYHQQDELSLHPLWEETDEGIFINRITGKTTSIRPRETEVKGGILAEEMGLGKTIELLSLILSHQSPSSFTKKAASSKVGPLEEGVDYSVNSGATLIISPSAIVCQWIDEIEQHAPSLNVYHYQGVNSSKITTQEIAKFDVVVTTYECLRGEIYHARDPSDRSLRHNKRFVAKRSPLVEISWWRVCLDEAQMVESTAAHAAEMALRLETQNRWAVTGTPIGKGGLEDLYGLFLFLQCHPPADKFWWKNLVHCYKLEGEGEAMTSPLVPLLKRMMWRTSKNRVQHEILLPPQRVETIPLGFSQVEQFNYTQQHDGCKALIQAGNVGPMIINQMVLQLRQTCCHPQIGAQNQRVFGGEYKSMEEVLVAMKKKAVGDLSRGERMLCHTKIRMCVLLTDYLDRHADAERILLELLEFSTQRLKETSEQQEKERSAPSSSSTATDKAKEKEKEIEIEMEKEKEEEEIAAPVATRKGKGKDKGKGKEKVVEEPEGGKDPLEEMGDPSEKKSSDEDEAEMRKRPWQEMLFRILNRLAITLEKKGDRKGAAAYTKRRDNLKEDILENVKKGFVIGQEKVAHHVDSERLYVGVPNKFPSAINRSPVLFDLEDLGTMLNKDLRRILGLRTDIMTWIQSDLSSDPPRPRLLGEYTVLLLERMEKISGIRLGLSSEQKGVSDWWEDDISVENFKYMVRALQHDAERHPQVPVRKELMKIHMDLTESLQYQIKLVKNLESEFNKFKSALGKRDSCLSQEARLVRSLHVNLLGEKDIDDEVEGEQEDKDEEKKIKDPKEVLKKLGDEIGAFEGEIKRATGRRNYLETISSESNNKEGEDSSCGICCDDIERGLLTLCGHLYCEACLSAWVSKHHKCPFCMTQIQSKDELTKITLKRPAANQQQLQASTSASALAANNNNNNLMEETIAGASCPAYDEGIKLAASYGAKIEALTRYLLHLKRKNPEVKSLVFSQWEQVLRLVTMSLEQNDIKFVRLEGAGKKNAVVQFRNDPETRVFLLNANSQSAGLTLVGATHVFLIEPVLNPAVELQAINRVHRIGQKKETIVHRLIIKDTIEEKLHEVAAQNRARTRQEDAVSVVVNKQVAHKETKQAEGEFVVQELRELFGV